MIEKGGRRDVFLGTRECQAYVEPCTFGEGQGYYDDTPELAFGLMFHGFTYPDEGGNEDLTARFWAPVMRKGIIDFIRPEDCPCLSYTSLEEQVHSLVLPKDAHQLGLMAVSYTHLAKVNEFGERR